MDEREVHELLHGAAENVQPSPDLPDRAERRYRGRRARGRVLVGALVVALVGSGIATAQMVRSDDETPEVVAPKPTTTTIGTPSRPIDLQSVTALSFVDRNIGFALLQDATPSGVIRTDDGGQTWRRVGRLHEPNYSLHFETQLEGIAWGDGALETTSDGGVHWSVPKNAPRKSTVFSWQGDRIWSLDPCQEPNTCGSEPLRVSDDAGRTWRETAPFRQGLGYATVLAESASTVLIVEPATDDAYKPGPWQLVSTDNGGASWRYEPVPCDTGTVRPILASNGRALLLVCEGQPAGPTTMRSIWRSTDHGKTWTRVAHVGGRGVTVTAVGPTFVATTGSGPIFASTDDGLTWRESFQLLTIPPTISQVPGIGIWLLIEREGDLNGLWFSTNGIDWAARALG